MRVKAIQREYWLILVSRPCNSIRPNEVLAFGSMLHSTCGWIQRKAKPLPIFWRHFQKSKLPESSLNLVRQSRRIARRIVGKREQGQPITTTKELADVVLQAIGGGKWKQIHPATRTFQALRIAVNKELDGLGQFVESSIDLLKPGGQFVAISFHSLEDRIIKQELRRLSGHCQCPPRLPVCSCGTRKAVEILTRRPVTASDAELDENPRARSAKLRACRKLISG